MLSQIKRLGGDSLLYALMNVGTKLIAFLMLPIYTLYLGPAEIGALENIDALTAILTFVVIFGTDSALAFYFFDTEDKVKKEQYVKTVLSFRLFISISLLLLAVMFGDWISLAILGTKEYSYIITIAMSVLVLEAVITLVLTYYRFSFKVKRVVGFTVLKLCLIAILSYLLLRFYSPTLDAIIYGRILGVGVVFVFLLLPFLKFIQFKVNKEVLKEILRYAAPLVPASLAFWIIASSNRFFLSYFDSLESVGVYGVAVKFATVITLLTSGVQMAWRPYSMSIKNKTNAKEIFAKFYLIILFIGIVGVMGVATFIPFIFSFMIPDPRFSDATKYIALLSMGTFLNFYYLIISVGLFIHKETKVISFYFAIAAIVSLILNVILIPLFSLWGAAAALVIAYFLATALIFRKSQQVYHVPVPSGKMLFLLLNGFLAMLAIVYIYEFTSLHYIWIAIPWLYMLIIFVVSNVWREIKMIKES